MSRVHDDLFILNLLTYLKKPPLVNTLAKHFDITTEQFVNLLNQELEEVVRYE